MKNMFNVFLISMLVASCASLKEIDAPFPPDNLLWSKNGSSVKKRNFDYEVCRSSVESVAGTSMDVDKCMLERNYIFNDNVNGYKRVCRSSFFLESPGCMSMQKNPPRRYESSRLKEVEG